jgi:hypothetical protein
MSTILDLGIMVVSGQLDAPLYPRGNSPRYTLDRRLDGAQSRSGRCSVEKNCTLPGIEPGPSSLLPVTIPTELSRLLCTKDKKR